MEKFSGIDLHSNNLLVVVVVTDERDRVLFQRQLPNDLPVIIAALEPHRAELIGVVVESTYNWHWLIDGLSAAGFRMHLANTTAIKKYEGLKFSGDDAAAAYLAHLPSSRYRATGVLGPDRSPRCHVYDTRVINRRAGPSTLYVKTT